jgi:hypothetical protein
MIAPANRQDGHRAPAAPRERIAVRTIGVTIGMVLATAAILLLGWEVRRVLTWIVVAALFSVILSRWSTWPSGACTCAGPARRRLAAVPPTLWAESVPAA